MFGERLKFLIHQCIGELDEDITLLEAAIAASRGARAALEEVQWVGVLSGDSQGSPPDEVRHNGRGRNSGTGPAAMETIAGLVPADVKARLYPSVGDRVLEIQGVDQDKISVLENALSNSGITRKNPIIEMVRVIAAANDGVIVLQETCAVLKKMNLSRSSSTNLPGYLIKKMLQSQEFVKAEEFGRGVYRWLLFNEPVIDAGGVSLESVAADEPGESTGPFE